MIEKTTFLDSQRKAAARAAFGRYHKTTVVDICGTAGKYVHTHVLVASYPKILYFNVIIYVDGKSETTYSVHDNSLTASAESKLYESMDLQAAIEFYNQYIGTSQFSW